MAKKIVEVDEDLLKGMMTSDIPLYGRDTEPAPKKVATAEPENISDAPAEREISEQPKSVRNRRKKESGSDYRELFLVNTPSPNRSQTYINRDIYERIKRFLPLIGYSQQIDPHKIIKNAPLVIMWCLLSQMGVLGMSSGLF